MVDGEGAGRLPAVAGGLPAPWSNSCTVVFHSDTVAPMWLSLNRDSVKLLQHLAHLIICPPRDNEDGDSEKGSYTGDMNGLIISIHYIYTIIL